METGLALLLCARALYTIRQDASVHLPKGCELVDLGPCEVPWSLNEDGTPASTYPARQLVAKHGGNGRIAFDEPLMVYYDTDHAGRERCNVTAWPMQVDSLGWQVDQHGAWTQPELAPHARQTEGGTPSGTT